MEEKIKIVIAGLRFGSTVIEEMLAGEGNPYFALYGVCDIDRIKTDEAAAKYKTKAFYSLDGVLADPEVQVIGLYTPPAGRAALIRQIIRSGRDVMTTKPFELDPVKALEVLEEANELGRIVHLNSPGPVLHETLRQIEEWAARYDLGRPVGWRADIWVNYLEKPDGSWYDDPARCPVAPIFRLGIYIINDMVRLFGAAKQVAVMSTRLLTERPTADNSQLSIQFQNGALANIFGSFCIDDTQRYKGPMTINYEHGTIYVNVMPTARGETGTLTLVAKDGATGERIIEEAPSRGGSGRYQWEVFHEAVNKRHLNSQAYMQDIVEGLKIIEAMRRADLSGMIEKVEGAG